MSASWGCRSLNVRGTLSDLQPQLADIVARLGQGEVRRDRQRTADDAAQRERRRQRPATALASANAAILQLTPEAQHALADVQKTLDVGPGYAGRAGPQRAAGRCRRSTQRQPGIGGDAACRTSAARARRLPAVASRIAVARQARRRRSGQTSRGRTMTTCIHLPPTLRSGVALGLVALLGACSSVSPPRFHTLMPALVSTTPTIAPAGKVAWEVLPVAVPAQVDQPQWVVRAADGSLAVLELERWIAPLGEEIRAAVADRVTQALGIACDTGRTRRDLARPDRRTALRDGARSRGAARSHLGRDFERREDIDAALPRRLRSTGSGRRLPRAGQRPSTDRGPTCRQRRPGAQGAQRWTGGDVFSLASSGGAIGHGWSGVAWHA